ncbi:DnaJ domain-containing protein [Desulfobacterales bacterium HSG17]|nr:DnaJ domain-containing protein [Desulfobacterales bacterium HSG17]
MSLYLKIILILFGLAYLISPVDIIPDLLLPFVGWIDDGVVIATIYYLIRFGRLPNFFFKKQNPFKQGRRKPFRPNVKQDFAGFTSKQEPNQQRTYHQQQTAKNRTSKTIPTPYDILGISPDANQKEIHNAYKQAIKKYHPDKLSHLGKEFSNLANEKFLEIQRAYDSLKTKHTG